MTAFDSRPFIPKSRADELDLLLQDDPAFTETKKYLEPLLRQTLEKSTLNEEDRRRLHEKLEHDIEAAAQRFIEEDPFEKHYSFSTFFSRFLADRLLGT